MIARNHYDDETLHRLLLNRLGEESSEISRHVEFCESCQTRMEDLSRDGMTWGEVADLLSPDEASSAAEQCESSGAQADGLRPAISFLEPTELADSLGRFARYEIMELLGRGGMGIVMRGYDTSLNRHSAIKVLAPELATSAAARKRFSREAKSAAAVVHPHVVPIQTVDEHNGLPYLVMPVVEGQSVDTRVRERGPLDVIESVRIAVQVAEGLSAAHEKGLVHRDIKPANVLLENGVERVQITDFGLARAIDDASMTRSGVIAGTPQYMSPEQAHGDAIDHRSDLFSLGSLIYFILTGRSPFRAETTMGVLNRIGNDEPRPIRSINADVPEWLEQIVTKLLAKSPADRYQTASEVAEDLQRWHAHLLQPDQNPEPRWRNGSTVDADSGGNSGFAPPWRWLIATAGFAFLAFAAVIIVLESRKGTIRIETNSEIEIPIVIRQGDRDVEHLTVSREGTTSRLRAGRYIIEIEGDDTQLSITGKEVKLSRGGVWVATVHAPELSQKDESKRLSRRDGSPESTSSSEPVSKYMDYPKIEGLKIWNNILGRCPKEGVAIIQFDNSRFRGVIPNAMSAIAEESDVPVVQMNLDVVHPVYVLVKDRILLQCKNGPLTEKQQRDFIKSAANYLTPRQSDVDPRSVMRFDCYINGRIGTMNASPHPLSGTVIAQHEGRALVLGPSSIAGFLGDGHQCLATFHNENGASTSVPFDVVHAGPVRLATDGELVESGLGVYVATGVPSIRSVQLSNARPDLSVGDRLLCGMAKRPFRRQPGGFQNYHQRVYWTTQSLTDVGNSNYGDSSGPKLVKIAFSGDNMPTLAAFTESGEFIGHGVLVDAKNKEASILGPEAVHATLRAALPLLENEGLKQALAAELEAAEKRPSRSGLEETQAAPSSNANRDVENSHDDRPKFGTPEALMKHFADCQFRDDTEGCLDCYSDNVIHGFATSYLMTAMMMRSDFGVGDRGIESNLKHEKMMKELDAILSGAMIVDPPAIASLALAQAAKAYREASDATRRDALTNDQLGLIAATPTLLKDSRKFVTDFALWSDGHEDEASKEPTKKTRYRIEYDGDSVYSIDPDDESRIGLKRFGDTWLIYEPWQSKSEEPAPVDDSP